MHNTQNNFTPRTRSQVSKNILETVMPGVTVLLLTLCRCQWLHGMILHKWYIYCIFWYFVAYFAYLVCFCIYCKCWMLLHMLHIWYAFAYCAFHVCYCIHCTLRILTHKVKLVKVHMHNTQDNFTPRTV